MHSVYYLWYTKAECITIYTISSISKSVFVVSDSKCVVSRSVLVAGFIFSSACKQNVYLIHSRFYLFIYKTLQYEISNFSFVKISTVGND